MTDTSDLSLVYHKQIVLTLIERTMSCSLIWSKTGNFYFQTSTREDSGSFSHVWDFVLSRISDTGSYHYKLDISLDTDPYLSLDSVANIEVADELSELFQRVELIVLNELAEHIEVNTFVQNIPNAGRVFDFSGLGGVLVGGHATGRTDAFGSGGVLVGGSAIDGQIVKIGGVLVGGSASLTYPPSLGIYLGGGIRGDFYFKKYSKNVIDSGNADPFGGPPDVTWGIPRETESGLAFAIEVGLNGLIYVTGDAQDHNTPDTRVYDANANKLLEVSHQIDLNPGSVNTNAAAFADIAVDSQGNFIIVGAPLGNQITDPTAIRSVWKHDLQGNVLFSYKWGTTSCTGVCVDEADNFYVIGNTDSGVNFRKFDKTGTVLWSVLTPGFPQAIVTDQKYLYVVGTGVMKYDLSGTLIWYKTQEIGEQGQTRNLPAAKDVAVGNNNLIYVGGDVTGDTTVVNGVTYYYENYLRCFDANGNRVWLSSGLRDTPVGLTSISCDGRSVYATDSSSLAIGVFNAATGTNTFTMTLPYSLTSPPPYFESIMAIALDPIDLTETGGVIVGGSAQLAGNVFTTRGSGGVVVGGAGQTSDNILLAFQFPNTAVEPTTPGHRWLPVTVNFKTATLGAYVDEIPSVAAITMDASKNRYTVGHAYLSSLQLKKYDSSETILWQKRTCSSDTVNVYAVVLDASNNVIVGAAQNGTIFNSKVLYKYDSSGSLLWAIDNGTLSYADSSVAAVYHLATDSVGNIYAGFNQAVLVFDPSGNFIWGVNGFCAGLVLDKLGFVYILDTSSHPALTKVGAGATPGWTIKLPLFTGIQWAKNLAIDYNNNIWLSYNYKIFKFDKDGNLLGAITTPVPIPSGGSADNRGGILIDIDNNLLVHTRSVDSSGTITSYLTKILADPAYSATPPAFQNDLTGSYTANELAVLFSTQIDTIPLAPSSIGAIRYLT